MRRLRWSAMFLLLWPLMAHAQSYTFQVVNIPAPTNPHTQVQFRALLNNGALAACDPLPSGLCYRVTLLPSVTLEPVTCTSDEFVRAPEAVHGGPDVFAQNEAHAVVGQDQGWFATVGRPPILVGFGQLADGTCDWYQFPGSAFTIFVGVNNTGKRLGYYIGDPVEGMPGILQYHAFFWEAGTVTPIATPSTNDVVVPDGFNDAGDHIGHAFLNIQPDSSFTYTAYYNTGGTFTFVTGSGGAALCLTGLNNSGLAVGIENECGIIGGDAIVYNHATNVVSDFPDPPSSPGTEIVLVVPVKINDLGQVVGFYVESRTDCAVPGDPACRTLHGFLATPAPMPPPSKLKPPRHRKQRHHERRQHLPSWREVQRWQEWGFALPGMGWQLVEDESGEPCLSDGVQCLK